MSDLLDELNPMQQEAVRATEGPCLVIAGAGSGKTKVLTHKIAYLMQEKNVAPWNILAITFTNKAANEMKERVAKLVGDQAKDLWMGTFHSICVKILRSHIDRIGFDSSFIIFDTSDQRTMIKRCIKELDLDDKMFTDRHTSSSVIPGSPASLMLISAYKNPQHWSGANILRRIWLFCSQVHVITTCKRHW